MINDAEVSRRVQRILDQLRNINYLETIGILHIVERIVDSRFDQMEKNAASASQLAALKKLRESRKQEGYQ